MFFFQFSQNNRLKEKLTGTYPKILVEASPVDTIWGIGCANDDPAAWDQSTWRGKNYLGFVLTEVRDELLCDAKFITPDEKKVIWCHASTYSGLTYTLNLFGNAVAQW